jgi:hypothetical protein
MTATSIENVMKSASNVISEGYTLWGGGGERRGMAGFAGSITGVHTPRVRVSRLLNVPQRREKPYAIIWAPKRHINFLYRKHRPCDGKEIVI